MDLKGTDDNPAVQGKLISRLSANLTTSATGSRPTDSSLALASPPSNNYRRSVDNESIYNESIYNDNESVYNASVYTGSVKRASVELYSPSINTQNYHTVSPETTPIMTISTTLPSLELQQSLPNIPTRPVFPGGTSTGDHPENPQRPSTPGVVPPGQPITNGRHNFNVNEDQYEPLPEGWEKGVDIFGLTYYANRHARSITRNRPSSNQAVDHQAETATTGSGSLPAGWEVLPSGGQVNHSTHITTSVDPRLQINTRVMDLNGEGSLRPQTISQIGPLPSGWEMRRKRPSRGPPRPRNIVFPAPLSQAPAQPAVPSQLPYLQQQPPPPREHVQDEDDEDAPVHVTAKSKRPQRSHSQSNIGISVLPPVRAPPSSTL